MCKGPVALGTAGDLCALGPFELSPNRAENFLLLVVGVFMMVYESLLNLSLFLLLLLIFGTEIIDFADGLSMRIDELLAEFIVIAPD